MGQQTGRLINRGRGHLSLGPAYYCDITRCNLIGLGTRRGMRQMGDKRDDSSRSPTINDIPTSPTDTTIDEAARSLSHITADSACLDEDSAARYCQPIHKSSLKPGCRASDVIPVKYGH
ncbi:hypothetical protein Bbelb_001720 [Branchiostoma belcheri]|nr:hypothetical protein Bbelb_001720 [Branchiostoma belcheri]